MDRVCPPGRPSGKQVNNTQADNPQASRWEHFHHVADVGIRGCGPTMATAFEQAALAMMAVITEPARIRTTENLNIQCQAPDPELLLTDWLNAIIYEMATRKMLFGKFRVRIEDGRLNATIHGEPVNVNRHTPAAEIKGATMSELKVDQAPAGGWIAQCIVDV